MQIENQGSAVCSSDDYQEYAAESLDCARSAKSEKERTIFLQMTRLWLHAALRRLDPNPRIIFRTSPVIEWLKVN